MKPRIFNLAFLLVLLIASSCAQNAEKKKLANEVIRLETEILSDSSGILDRNKGLEMIQAYENYANALPKDSLAPEYLYKGAEIAMNLQMAGTAIEYHQRILNNYPDFDNRAYCIFLQAFIYENQMQQYEPAKKLYQEFIDSFPEHPLADDAAVSISNMGKSLEELIQSWEKKENN